MSEIFVLQHPKTSYEAGHVDIDLAIWLKTETISSVNFSAKNLKTKAAAPEVIDSIKSTHSGVYLKPYIQNGVTGQSYVVRMKVVTNQVSKGDFYLIFGIKDY